MGARAGRSGRPGASRGTADPPAPRRALRPLRGTWREVLAERRDRRLARAEQRRTAWAPTDIERRELRALAVRRRAGLAGPSSCWRASPPSSSGRWRGSPRGRAARRRLAAPGHRDARRRVRAATTGWVSTGLGAPAPADPSCPRSSPRRCSPGRHADRREPARPRVLPRRGPGRVVRRGRGHALRAAPRLGDPRLGGCSRAPHGRGRRPGRRRPRARHAPVARARGRPRARAPAARRRRAPDAGRRPPRRTPRARLARRRRHRGPAARGRRRGAPVLLPVGVVVLVVVALGARAHRRYLALVPVPSSCSSPRSSSTWPARRATAGGGCCSPTRGAGRGDAGRAVAAAPGAADRA